MQLSIIVPVLNEETILTGTLEELELLLQTAGDGILEVVAVDSGSEDRSADILERWAAAGPGRVFACLRGPSPDIGAAVAEGVKRSSGDSVLVLPADCSLRPDSLRELLSGLQSRAVGCGGFEKEYSPDSPSLRAYSWLQNNLRARLWRNLVWTHAIFFRRDQVPTDRWPASGFLGDIRLSDAIKRHAGWKLLRPPVRVSSRRYRPGSRLLLMVDNVIILALYRLGLATPERLRNRYRRGPWSLRDLS